MIAECESSALVVGTVTGRLGRHREAPQTAGLETASPSSSADVVTTDPGKVDLLGGPEAFEKAMEGKGCPRDSYLRFLGIHRIHRDPEDTNMYH